MAFRNVFLMRNKYVVCRRERQTEKKIRQTILYTEIAIKERCMDTYTRIHGIGRSSMQKRSLCILLKCQFKLINEYSYIIKSASHIIRPCVNIF